MDIMVDSKQKPGIIRDERYEATLRRDLRRQKTRRWVHQWMCRYEILRWWPKWKKKGEERGKEEKQRHPLKKLGAKRPTLSVCIITMNSAQRIRPLLTYIRTFADEVVVGVDSKTTDNTLAACEGLADELFMIENDALTCNSGLEALVNRCHGDWVLRLDDDEFPEPLFAALRDGLIATEKYTHYKFPRLHLASAHFNRANESILTWINDSYLYPDFQMRLFRNDPALLSFPGAVGHSSIQCAGPRGKVNTVNLIHLNMAINPRFKREEKLNKYVLRLNGEWVHPVNERALLFEDFNYRIEPYGYPDADFCRLLVETTLEQSQAYEVEHQASEKTSSGLSIS